MSEHPHGPELVVPRHKPGLHIELSEEEQWLLFNWGTSLYTGYQHENMSEHPHGPEQVAPRHRLGLHIELSEE